MKLLKSKRVNLLAHVAHGVVSTELVATLAMLVLVLHVAIEGCRVSLPHRHRFLQCSGGRGLGWWQGVRGVLC